MNGAVMQSGTYLSALADPNWKVVGAHDFNGDWETDILWRHDVSGENVLWYMNGGTLQGGTFLTPPAVADTNWRIVGAGRLLPNLFNGTPQIVWHHQVSGEIVLWWMDGSVMSGGTFTNPRSVSDTNWRIVGVADFNYDGYADLLWHHQVSGEIVVWYLSNATLMSGTFASPSAVSDTNWKIVAVGDYNADRKPDIVWRHAVSGENAIWFMDGVTLAGGTFTTPSALPDANWKIVGPR